MCVINGCVKATCSYINNSNGFPFKKKMREGIHSSTISTQYVIEGYIQCCATADIRKYLAKCIKRKRELISEVEIPDAQPI